MLTTETIWVVTGFLGQGLFFGRWIVQWLGGLITLAYAIYRKDPVFIAGQSIGAVVYVRNLMLIYRPNHSSSATGDR